MPALEEVLNAALKSREERHLRCQLSDPTSDVGFVDFHTNDYLSLSSSQDFRSRFLSKLHAAPDILGSGGSRLLVNAAAHYALETRLAAFFGSPSALLFNSGFDANVGFFSCIPQQGDIVVFDEDIHASVIDGIRASRAKGSLFSFEHNSLPALDDLLLRLIQDHPGLTKGTQSIFVVVESLYSMDGTLAPLLQIVEMMETLFPKRNGYVVVDEAHSSGIYGPQGRGLVAQLGLERRVLARLLTLAKAHGGSGAVVLTSTVIRDYLLNYSRLVIYSTSLSKANVIAVDCSFDLLEDGTTKELSTRLLTLSTHFTSALSSLLFSRPHIPTHLFSLPSHLASPPPASSTLSPSLSQLPTPIIPVFTSSPRPLSEHLRQKGMNVAAITWPAVSKGTERVRVCLHTGNTREEVERLAREMVEWVKGELREAEQDARQGKGKCEREYVELYDDIASTFVDTRYRALMYRVSKVFTLLYISGDADFY